MTYRKEMIEEMYLDYVNNFLTVERFAEYYGIRLGTAHMIIEVGRAWNNGSLTVTA